MTSTSLENLFDGIPEVLVRFLKARGYLNVEDWEPLFRPRLSQIKNPFSLDQMDIVVQRLIQAYVHHEGLLVYGDFDLDGSSGAAILYTSLKSLGFKNIYYIQPRRLTEGYGFHWKILQRYEEKNIRVVITVDVGITGVETTQYAQSRGIDVLITDHHLPQSKLPEALAIVNPNKGFCSSHLGYLCGAGVAYYVFLALWMRLKELISSDDLHSEKDKELKKLLESQKETIFNIDPKSSLDLFTIGTLTDLVPLVKENRVLVKHGLKVLERTKRKGLSALLQKLGLKGKKLSSQDINFKLAPKLNSLSRMDKGLLPIDVFLCEDETQAERMVEQILSLNKERLQLQKSAETLAIQREFDSEDPFCFVYDASFHKGVIGLVATRLAQIYKKPAFVGGGIKGDQIFGSARLPEGSSFHLIDIMSSCPTLENFGGHAQAAGFNLIVQESEIFRNELRRYFKKEKTDSLQDTLSKGFAFDVEVKLDEMNPELLKWMSQLEPFGAGFGGPVFKITNLHVISYNTIMKSHLKFKISEKKIRPQEITLTESPVLDCIWFHHTLDETSLRQMKLVPVDLYGQLEWNDYTGLKKLQFLVRHLSLSSYEN